MKIDLKRICVPTDFSEPSSNAVRYGATLAERFGAELHLLHIIEDPIAMGPEPGVAILPTEELYVSLERGASEKLDGLNISDWAPHASVVRTVRHGSPHREIGEYAKKNAVDLLVLGTHGRTGLYHLLVGSVAEKVVRTAPCPVLTVHEAEREFLEPE